MSGFKLNEPKTGSMAEFRRWGLGQIIDGRRRGVREALEDQTMNMAKAWPN